MIRVHNSLAITFHYTGSVIQIPMVGLTLHFRKMVGWIEYINKMK